jgi:CheY-like chemotaxis protein
MADLGQMDQPQFAKWVRHAFAHLYDSSALQRNPIALMVSRDEGDPMQRGINLRKLLLESIRLVRPVDGAPADSADWRQYRILRVRYIEGMTPQQAMQELALGRSQFYDEQSRVLEVIAARLWDQLRSHEVPAQELPTEEGTGSLLQQEISRLYSQLDWGLVDATGLLEELRPTLLDLFARQGAHLQLDLAQGLILPWANRVLLRQAVLSLITALLDTRAVHCLQLALTVDGIYCQVLWDGTRPPETLAVISSGRLATARQLVRELGGKLDVSTSGASLAVALCFKKGRERSLLVVDDNTDLVALFRRYLATQPWQVAGAANCMEARTQIAAKLPTVIALDVLMPKEDGWELLSSLKRNAVTHDIPVMVCSVINQAQLALSLGADAYLAKPVTQEALLAMLRRWG